MRDAPAREPKIKPILKSKAKRLRNNIPKMPKMATAGSERRGTLKFMPKPIAEMAVTMAASP